MSAPPEIEALARVIYDRRPYFVAATKTVIPHEAEIARKLSYDGAPAYYQNDCREIATAILAAGYSRPLSPRAWSLRIFLALLAVAGPVAVAVALVRWVAG